MPDREIAREAAVGYTWSQNSGKHRFNCPPRALNRRRASGLQDLKTDTRTMPRALATTAAPQHGAQAKPIRLAASCRACRWDAWAWGTGSGFGSPALAWSLPGKRPRPRKAPSESLTDESNAGRSG